MRRITVVFIVLGFNIVVVCVLFLLLFLKTETTTLKNYLEKDPLLLENTPDELWNLLQSSSGISDYLYDSWSFSFEPSDFLRLFGTELEIKARNLNDAIRLISEGSYSEAEKRLSTYYHNYPDYVSVFSTTHSNDDPLPSEKRELAFYSVYLYHRGIVSLERATKYYRNNKDKDDLLKRALYDLRRATGAAEKLGMDGYWQNQQAWENVSFDLELGNLPVYKIYAALSTAYLRIKDSKGYPPLRLNYLIKMNRRYSLGDIGISPITRKFIEIVVSEDKRNAERYRLTHALHNLEAASRGLTEKGIPKMDYLIGIVLMHLGKMSKDNLKNETYDFSIKYLSRVLDNLDTLTDPGEKGMLHDAVRRALVLIYLELKNNDKVLELLSEMDPLQTRGSLETIIGNRMNYELLFTDIAQYANFSKGNIEHINYYEKLRKQEINDNKHENFHNKIMNILAQNFYSSLEARFYSASFSEISHLGSVLSIWTNDYKYNGLNIISDPISHMNVPFGVLFSLSIHYYQLKPIVIFLSFILVIISTLYFYWVYISHKKIAKRIFESGYQKDLNMLHNYYGSYDDENVA